MPAPTPYRSLPLDRRLSLVSHALKSSKEARSVYIQRLAGRTGFRPVTLQTWSTDKLAHEIVRTNAQSANDELDLLHLLYVELEPEIQITFLDAAGVSHEKGVIPDDLPSPYADAATIARAADVVRAKHDEDGMRYLRTLARYARDAWPGIDNAVTELDTERSKP